jgi:hypothetical protein
LTYGILSGTRASMKKDTSVIVILSIQVSKNATSKMQTESHNQRLQKIHDSQMKYTEAK